MKSKMTEYTICGKLAFQFKFCYMNTRQSKTECQTKASFCLLVEKRKLQVDIQFYYSQFKRTFGRNIQSSLIHLQTYFTIQMSEIFTQLYFKVRETHNESVPRKYVPTSLKLTIERCEICAKLTIKTQE